MNPLRSHAHVKNGECFGMESTLSTIIKVHSAEKLSKCEGNDRLLVSLHILSNNDLHPEPQCYHVKDVVKISVIHQSWINIRNSLLSETLLLCRKGPGPSYFLCLYKHQIVYSNKKPMKAINVARSFHVLHTVLICRNFILQRLYTYNYCP